MGSERCSRRSDAEVPTSSIETNMNVRHQNTCMRFYAHHERAEEVAWYSRA